MADFDHNPRGGLTTNRESLHASAEYKRQVAALEQMRESEMDGKMTTMAQVPSDHPLMIAWEAHKQTDAYANSKKWATHPQYLDGPLWALFEAGFRAAHLTQPAQAVDVVAVREVIAEMRTWQSYCAQTYADTLTRAIGNAQAEGWRLVPIEPNESMRAAALTTGMPSIGEPPLYEKIWRRMLDAAPTQATPNAHE